MSRVLRLLGEGNVAGKQALAGAEPAHPVIRLAEPNEHPVAPPQRDPLSWFFGALLFINLVLLVVYQFLTFRLELHSDSAVKVLLANEIYQSGEFFPKDWVYANGDIYAFFSHTLAIPLIPLLGTGFATHAVTGLLISLLLLLVTWLLLRELPFRRWHRLAILSFLASGVSSLLAENLYGQMTYGFIIMLNLAIVTLALRWVRNFPGRASFEWPPLIALGVLSLLVTWNNPKRALVMLVVPFLASCAAVAATRLSGTRLSFARLKAVPELWVGLAQAAGFLVGSLCYFAVMNRPINNVDAAAQASWLASDAIWRNAGYAVLGVLAQLGGVPVVGGPVGSPWGAYEALRVLLAIVLLWGVLRVVRRLAESPASSLRFVAVFTMASGGLALLFYVFTTLPDMVNPLVTARYLVPALFTGLLLLPALMGDSPWGGGRTGIVMFGAVVLTGLLGAMTLAIPGYGSTGRTWEEATFRGSKRLDLVAFLKKQGLRYGYATYWNAGAFSVLSGGEVKVRQIEIAGDLPVPMHHHASNQWFRPSQWSGESFLLLNQGELKKINRALLDAQLGTPTRTVTFGDVTVLVYPENPSNKLAGWSDLMEKAQTFEVSSRSPHLIGRYQASDPSRGSLTSSVGEKGELLFGPFMWLAAGNYRVSFDVAGEGAPSLGKLEVTAAKGAVKLVEQPLAAGPRQSRVLEFKLEREWQFVEFRVLTNGSGSISVYGVTIERAVR